ncbi:hypothetical protein WIW50_09315 [Flavobacteriaceae bacterium 3-367]
MGRFKLGTVNWKYIAGEVLLIFIGINLAIWFNTWNTNREIDKKKNTALQMIQEEIRNNLEDLADAEKNNQQIPLSISAYEEMTSNDTGVIQATSQTIREFQAKFPGFYTVTDSVPLGDDHFAYTGATFINLELTELSKIAWETAKGTAIANEFAYECLYALEDMYSLQDMVQREMGKASEALQVGNIELLLKILEFINQLNPQLVADYKNMLAGLDDCY